LQAYKQFAGLKLSVFNADTFKKVVFLNKHWPAQLDKRQPEVFVCSLRTQEEP